VRPGETISSTGLTKRAGGKGANQAYALSKAGGSVTLDGNVGKDGVWVKEMLGENGVDVSRVGVVDEEVGSLSILEYIIDPRSREEQSFSERQMVKILLVCEPAHWPAMTDL
jgi:sugar/nucleoside kinase (ribokinase family)